MADRGRAMRIARTVVGLVALGVIVGVGVFFAMRYLGGGPEGVARRFLQAVARRDLDAARKLMTLETQQTDAPNLERGLAKGSTFTLGEVNQTGPYATVSYTTANGASGQVRLQQRDGRWLVYGDALGPFMAPE